MQPMTSLRAVPLLAEDARWCLDRFGRLPLTHAVTLLPAGASEEQWLEARRTRVGASELAGIAGVPGAYGSWYASWWSKAEGWFSESSMAMRIGHLLEPLIARVTEEEKPWIGRLVRPGAALLGHPTMPWLCCTPDYLAITEPAEDCVMPMMLPGPCCLKVADSHQLDCQERHCATHGDPIVIPVECKSDEGGREWGSDMSRQVPPRYEAQALVQCDVLGAPYGWLARLASKRFTLHLVDFGKPPVWYGEVLEEGRRFITALEAGQEPDLEDIDGSAATSEALRRRFPDITDSEDEQVRRVFLPGDLDTRFRASRRLLAEAKEQVNRVDNQVRAAMGYAVEGLAPDGSVAVRRTISSRRAYQVKASTVDQLSVVTR